MLPKPMDEKKGKKPAKLRTCYSSHECSFCDRAIGLGEKYYDGGYGHRRHEECGNEEMVSDVAYPRGE